MNKKSALDEMKNVCHNILRVFIWWKKKEKKKKEKHRTQALSLAKSSTKTIFTTMF